MLCQVARRGDLAVDDGYGYFDEYSHRNGCDGSRCNRDHPTVTLRFDVSSRATVATMSHRLDPFVQYFNGRVSQGTAWPHSPTEYQLDGYIRANLTDLRSQQGFGGHLVTMESGSLDASDSAQREEQEEQERATKRQRVDGVSDASFVLFEEAIDIALKERLQKDLENDFMSLFCLRSTRVSENCRDVYRHREDHNPISVPHPSHGWQGTVWRRYRKTRRVRRRNVGCRVLGPVRSTRSSRIRQERED